MLRGRFQGLSPECGDGRADVLLEGCQRHRNLGRISVWWSAFSDTEPETDESRSGNVANSATGSVSSMVITLRLRPT